jgi:formylglycine-generating enzyme required for sulfatase activity
MFAGNCAGGAHYKCPAAVRTNHLENTKKAYSLALAVGCRGVHATEGGLCDMHGNVWEWVEYFWHLNLPGRTHRWLGVDETAQEIPPVRVLRGGCWSGYPGVLRSALRIGNGPVTRDYILGFRVARTLD